jgi:all-trans-8'-apo-beta-carotenal 15,15'-oxygenase
MVMTTPAPATHNEPRTPKYVAETESQSIRYRGFGTQVPGGMLRNLGRMPANPANTNTIYHAGKLFALNEGGHPWQVDPADLSTIGEHDFDGHLARSQVFSAHGRVHPQTGDYINFGAGMSGMSLKGPQPCLNVYRIDTAGVMVDKGQIPLDRFPFCHDFAITQHYAIFFIGSIVFDGMGKVILGRKTISDVVRYDASVPMQVLVVDLNTLEVVRTFSTDDGAIVHFGNAFEEGRNIIVDGMYQNGFAANATLENVFAPDSRFNGGWYNRYVLNMDNGTMATHRVADSECEFPTFNTRFSTQRHTVCYSACSIDNGANGFFNGLQRVEFDGNSSQLTLTPGYYGSEPLFVPATNATREDDGYLLVVVYNGYTHTSELHIHRADDLDDQVANLPLEHHVPHQFHGYFTPETFC